RLGDSRPPSAPPVARAASPSAEIRAQISDAPPASDPVVPPVPVERALRPISEDPGAMSWPDAVPLGPGEHTEEIDTLKERDSAGRPNLAFRPEQRVPLARPVPAQTPRGIESPKIVGAIGDEETT